MEQIKITVKEFDKKELAATQLVECVEMILKYSVNTLTKAEAIEHAVNMFRVKA